MTPDKEKRLALFFLACVLLGALLGALGAVLAWSPGVRWGLIGALIPCLYIATRARAPAQGESRSPGAR